MNSEFSNSIVVDYQESRLIAEFGAEENINRPVLGSFYEFGAGLCELGLKVGSKDTNICGV